MEADIKDALGASDHVWVSIVQNPSRKPLWPPVSVRVNEYVAVIPRGQKVLLAGPLVENLRHAVSSGRTQLQFSEMGTLSAVDAHAVRLQDSGNVFPRTCATPPAPSETKKGITR